MSQTQESHVTAVPAEVESCAAELGVEKYVSAVLDLTESTFPDAVITVAVELDPEIPRDRHITAFAREVRMTPELAVEATGRWDRGLLTVCPPELAWAFRLRLGFAR